MKQYTTIPKDIKNIDGNNKLLDTIVFAYIKSRMNYSTYISDVTEKELSAKLGIPLRTIVNCIFRLKENKLFNVEAKTIKTDNTYSTYNKYYLLRQKENYFYIYNDFFKGENNTDTCKVKGLLLLIKSVCLKETNKYFSKKSFNGNFNKTELSTLIGIDAKTLSKYLKMAIETKQIKIIDNGLLLLNKNIIPDFVKDDIYTKIFHTIYNWCIDNDIIPPNKIKGDRKANILLSRIISEYCIPEEDMNDKKLLNYYLPYILNKRIPNKPKEITWEYIATVLNKDTEIKQVKHLEFIM